MSNRSNFDVWRRLNSHDILPKMSDREGDDGQRRDALLRRLLKTPPQPRPKRERGKEELTRKLAKSASSTKRGAGSSEPP
jgi:hypothetical protein